MSGKRGRPVGWRKDVTRPHRVMVQFSEDEFGWLSAKAGGRRGGEGDVIRELIEQARAAELGHCSDAGQAEDR